MGDDRSVPEPLGGPVAAFNQAMDRARDPLAAAVDEVVVDGMEAREDRGRASTSPGHLDKSRFYGPTKQFVFLRNPIPQALARAGGITFLGSDRR